MLPCSQLPDLKSLETLPALPRVKEVNLRGNPLGLQNIQASDFIGALKTQFPDLECLDEQALSENANSVTQQNYLCSIEGFDVVEQFVRTYFEAFDLPTKKNLKSIILGHCWSTGQRQF